MDDPAGFYAGPGRDIAEPKVGRFPRRIAAVIPDEVDPEGIGRHLGVLEPVRVWGILAAASGIDRFLSV